MTSLTPFANDTESQNIGNLTLENGTEQVSIFGDLDLTKDKAGLRRARDLKAVLDQIVAALEADPNLPDKAPQTIEKPQQVKNPFE